MKPTRAAMVRPAVALALLIMLLGRHGATGAAEITIFASKAMATVLERIGPEFEEATGHTLRVMGDSPEFVVKRILADVPFDIVVAPTPIVDGLVKAAKVIAATRTPLVRSRVGGAVRAGGRKPGTSTPGAELAGPPPQRQHWIVFAAAVHTQAAEPGAARELIQFLARSKAHPAIAMQGMEPA